MAVVKTEGLLVAERIAVLLMIMVALVAAAFVGLLTGVAVLSVALVVGTAPASYETDVSAKQV